MNSEPATQPAALYSLRRVLMNLYVAMTGAYGLSVSGFLLLRALVGESSKIVTLFNNYIHLLLIPAIVLLPLSLLLRRPRLALTQAAPAAVFLATYGLMFWPRVPQIAPDKTRISLLSYNLNKNNASADAVIAIIRDANADVVALQELNPVLAAAFDTELADVYPYRAFHPDESYPGQGIMSRYPIHDDSYWKINLGHQRAQIDVNGSTITLYNTHPVHPFIREHGFFDPALRTAEIEDVLARAAHDSTPILIAGDFNMTDQTGDYQRIAAQFGDSYREVGWGLGFSFPDLGQQILLARIDYVFHSRDFQAVEARVWPTSGGSDHRPLFVTLAYGAGL
ncbi:MAG: endonuclease/exonuclease/phosphatase family protein [Chloroflexota bacterium]